jgi:uncharacterized damage-inducible protein DinB
MAADPKPRLKETVADCKARAEKAAERLVKTFSFVPDDKLNWAPSKTARTSLAVVAHCVMTNRIFAKVLRGEAISPMPTPDEVHASSREFEATIHDRAEVVRLLEASREEIAAAFATMTAERFATSPNSPFGPRPMMFWMSVPDMHMSYHDAQINYLQTIWGDLAMHA